MRKGRRILSGHMHVCVLGNNNFIVFYNDVDYIMFLRMLDKYAKMHGTIITELVLMTNHVHIQMITHDVTRIMSSLLNAYVKWYNRSHNSEGRLFKSPFVSAVRYSREWVINSQLYILKNPLKAGLCEGRTADYKWSSYRSHFGGKNHISKYITIDTSLMDSHLKSKWFLDKAIEKADFAPVSDTDVKFSDDASFENPCRMNRINNYKLCNYALKIIGGKSIYELSIAEINDLIIKLTKETDAGFKQIASLIHTNYDYVQKIAREDKHRKE